MLGSWPLRSFSLDFETRSRGGGLRDPGGRPLAEGVSQGGGAGAFARGSEGEGAQLVVMERFLEEV